MEVRRVVMLCEEEKTRFVYPAAFTLQTCGREVYLVHSITGCIAMMNKLTAESPARIIVVIPVMKEFNYSSYGWNAIRKSSVVGMNYFNSLLPFMQKGPNDELLSGLYAVRSSDTGAKDIEESMDMVGAENQLAVHGAILATSYSNAVERMIEASSIERSLVAAAADEGHWHDPSASSTPSSSLLLPNANLQHARRIVFVRHGQRLDEVLAKWADLSERPQDSPLTQKGVMQAMCAGVWLSGQQWSGDIKAVYASPFYRTVHTAQLVTDQLCTKSGSNMNTGMSVAMTNAVNMTALAAAMPTIAANSQPQVQPDELRVLVENGLCDEADWLAHNAKPTKPWYLRAADLYLLSNKIDLDYVSVKEPQFRDGDVYPGRPVEEEEPYDRCSATIWRLARCEHTPELREHTVVVVSHAGPIMHMVHALTGRGVAVAMKHTCITSVLFDDRSGEYTIEREQLLTNLPPIEKHFRSYSAGADDDAARAYALRARECVGDEILCSVKHLAEPFRS